MHILSSLSEPLIYLVALGIIFAETGIIACFFFPGDTLLFSLGIFAKQGVISLGVVLVVLIVASIAGNILGYYLGSFVRNKHQTSKLLRRIPEKYIVRTEKFYEKYGILTVMISRFIPVVRTVAPFLAGVSRMRYKYYLAFTIIGGVLWTCTISSAGYIFGGYLNIEKATLIASALMLTAIILTPLAVFITKRYLSKS